MIRQITEDMLLVVPEGSYQVVLSNNGVGCVKEITVERNKEVVLDVGDVEIAEDKTGMILFNVTPESASVSVDGKPVDISKAVEMRYGIHQVQVEASGYDTLTKYIQVGSEYATISFTLEETRKKDNDSDSLSGNSTERIPWQDTLASISGNSISDNTLSTLSENALGTSSNYKVYIDSPKGVEVYLDGNYIGLAPVRFTKSAGTHQITLRKDGYETKSYTIYLTNDRKDETYSFSDLVKIGSDDGSSGNSGNDGNSGDNNDGNKGDIGEPPLPPDDSEGTTSEDSTGTSTDPDDNEGDNNDKDDGDGDDKGSSEDGNGGKDENSESGEDGDDNDPETGGETGNSGGTEEQNAANSTTTKAHPIRDFFSSLFR